MLRSYQHPLLEARSQQSIFHDCRSRACEIRIFPVEKKAGRDKAVEGIANKAKLEVVAPLFRVEPGLNLAHRNMTVAQARNLWNGQRLLPEQDLLFPVLIAQMRTQCLTNRVRCGLRHSEENKLVSMRNDQKRGPVR